MSDVVKLISVVKVKEERHEDNKKDIRIQISNGAKKQRLKRSGSHETFQLTS